MDMCSSDVPGGAGREGRHLRQGGVGMMKILTVDDEKVELAPVDICQELLNQTYEESAAGKSARAFKDSQQGHRSCVAPSKSRRHRDWEA